MTDDKTLKEATAAVLESRKLEREWSSFLCPLCRSVVHFSLWPEGGDTSKPYDTGTAYCGQSRFATRDLRKPATCIFRAKVKSVMVDKVQTLFITEYDYDKEPLHVNGTRCREPLSCPVCMKAPGHRRGTRCVPLEDCPLCAREAQEEGTAR